MIIPWPVCFVVDWLASLFGYDTYVRATGGPGWHWGRVGAEAIFFTRRQPGSKRLKAVKPKAPINKDDSGYIIVDTDPIETAAVDYCRVPLRGTLILK